MSQKGAKNTNWKGKRTKRPPRDGIQEVPSPSVKQAAMLEVAKREAAEANRKAERERLARASAKRVAAKFNDKLCGPKQSVHWKSGQKHSGQKRGPKWQRAKQPPRPKPKKISWTAAKQVSSRKLIFLETSRLARVPNLVALS